MNVHDANERDAKYLASQMQTNSRVLQLRARMQQARDKLHDVLTGIDLLEDIEPTQRPIVIVPIPPIDRTTSVPRARSVSGTQIKAPPVIEIGVGGSPGAYALGAVTSKT